MWSEALNGLPFRGAHAPTLTREELERDVTVAWDFKFDSFDLTDPGDQERYRWVMDRAVNKWFYVHFVERHWIETEKKYIIYVEWSQRYGELSPVAKAGARSVTHGPPVPTQVEPPPLRVPYGAPLLAGFQKSDF